MLVKNPEECDAKQHRSRVGGIARMRTRGKFCKYDSRRNDQSEKCFCYL